MASGASVTASFIASLRPEQWSKNAFVFAGLLFGGRLTDGPQYLGAAVAAFAVFCGLSGAVYLINDVADGAPTPRIRSAAGARSAGDLTLPSPRLLCQAWPLAAVARSPSRAVPWPRGVPGLLTLYSAG